MTGKELFRIWAPVHKKWVDWVRPVVFVGMDDFNEAEKQHQFTIPTIDYIEEYDKHTAIIADLPGHEGVLEGLGLAKLGYRPIPLYNGTIEQANAKSLVSNKEIQKALNYGAAMLQDISLEQDAAPAFLLDSNRIFRFKTEISIFDNSWDLYDQDIPSPEYFIRNGIDRIIVRSEKISRDLQKILYKFQKKGIAILLANGYEQPQKFRIRKPPRKDKFH